MAIERIKITERQQWLKERRNDVTASDVAALFGLSPFKTALQLFLEKSDRGGGEIRDNSLLRRGRWLEAAALSALTDQHPEWHCRPAECYLRDGELRLGATPDLVKQSGEPVEIKAPTPYSFRDHWSDAPPVHYQLQALVQTMLLDQSQAQIVALVVSGFDAALHIYTIKRHALAEQKIIDGVRDFWRMVAAKEPPRADYSRDGAALSELYRTSDTKKIDLSANNRIAMLCQEKIQWSGRKTASEKALEVINSEIIETLGGAEIGAHPAFNITWKTQKRGEVIIPPSEYRVLRVTKKRGSS